MKKQLVIWMMLMCIHSSWAIPMAIPMDVGIALSPANYSNILQVIRALLYDPSPSRLFFGVPMLRKPTNPLTYFTFKLQSLKNNNITFAFETRNLNVVGYSDKLNNVDRAYILNDAPANAWTTAFPKVIAANLKSLKFGGSYPSLESKAGSRVKLGLGMQKLINQIDKVYGVAVPVEKNQAEFLLIAVQIVSEATRFKYIEDQVKANYKSFEFTPNPKVISLENEWGELSTGIRKAPPATGIINPPVTIIGADNKPVIITQAKTIAPDMGILNYVA